MAEGYSRREPRGPEIGARRDRRHRRRHRHLEARTGDPGSRDGHRCFHVAEADVLIGNEGPASATDVFVFSIFTAFWKDNRYGFASAMSVVLFLSVLLIAALLVKIFKVDLAQARGER